MSDPLSSAALAEARQQHIGRLLLQASRAFNARAIGSLQARGHADLSMVHANLLPHLDVAEGTRMTVLAERAGITKQAVGQLVADLEQAGYVERQPDPQDRRAQRICFTQRGQAYLLDALAVKHQIEAEYRALLGGDWERLRASLAAIIAAGAGG